MRREPNVHYAKYKKNALGISVRIKIYVKLYSELLRTCGFLIISNTANKTANKTAN